MVIENRFKNVVGFDEQKIRGGTPAFDIQLARNCADAFSVSTGLGCTIFSVSGEVIYETEAACGSCNFCGLLQMDDQSRTLCQHVHRYGLAQSERFGGKYVYFCPSGLTCFASPVIGEQGVVAAITAGPFLMVEPEDFIGIDLEMSRSLSAEAWEQVHRVLQKIPYVDPGTVSHYSTLLFMAVGFLNNAATARELVDKQASDNMQGQINDYISQLKGETSKSLDDYPFQMERELIQSIIDSDKAKAQKQLNELLGYIFFSLGGDLQQMKARVFELLVLISRAAIEMGSEPGATLTLNHHYMVQINTINSVDALCFWLTDIITGFMDSMFRFAAIKHVDVFHKALSYIRQNYTQKLTLEAVAAQVYLSPTYFSKLFKEEMGCNFSTYLNRLRIAGSKKLLLQDNIKTADIASLMGFESQSYFTRVFKQQTGVSPGKYRESRGRNLLVAETAKGALGKQK